MNPRALLALTLLAAAGTGCIDNRASVEPFGVCAPPDDASECSMDAECDALLSNRSATLYLRTAAGDNALLLWLQWNNQLPNNADPSSGRPNTNDAFLRTYKLSFSAPGLAIPDIEIDALEQPIPAGGSATAIAHVIPVETSAQLWAAIPIGVTDVRVLVKLRATGIYAHDASFETDEVQIPVAVRKLVFPGYVCADAAKVVTAVCPNVGQTASIKCE
jgi:hypothetical protein